jgi:hypothetical protein
MMKTNRRMVRRMIRITIKMRKKMIMIMSKNTLTMVRQMTMITSAGREAETMVAAVCSQVTYIYASQYS